MEHHEQKGPENQEDQSEAEEAGAFHSREA
jgi:hypothetical protein